METSRQTLSSIFDKGSCLPMAINILQKETEKGANFVFSPLSFNSMLSLLAAGATGSTLHQLLSFLGSESVEELNSLATQIANSVLLPTNASQHINGGPITSFVNGAWVDLRFDLKPSFEQVVKRVYNATARNVDFSNEANHVCNEVNLWVENATNGLIKNIIPQGSMDSETSLVLANALYFKGAWVQKFDSSQTKPKNFHLLNGQIIQVPFMIRTAEDHYDYGSFDGYKVVKLPYQKGQEINRQFSMYFFLPNTRNGLPNLVEGFKTNPMKLINPAGIRKRTLSHLWIPRFKFSFEFEGLKSMKELGLEQLFNSLGELTQMVDSSRSLSLSKLFHKSFVEVNEEGTEAAASSVALLRWACAMPLELPSFVADHPFLFTIKEENSGAVLFVGAVLNPI